MKQVFRQVTSYFLLAAFLFAIAPKEFIHEFTNHEDTCEHNYEGRQVSTRHTHCESLQLSLPAFTEAEKSHLLYLIFTFEQQIQTAQTFSGYYFSFIRPGRAPPAVA